MILIQININGNLTLINNYMKNLLIKFGIIIGLLFLGIFTFFLFNERALIENPKENFTKNQKAEVHFSKKMNKASVEKNLEIEPQIQTDFSWKNEKTLVIDLLDKNNETDNFSVILGPEIKDNLGRSIENPQKINFFVPAKDHTLILTTPLHNAKDIKGKMPITFLWDSPIFPLQRADIWQEKLKNEIIMTPRIDGSWAILGTAGIMFEPKAAWPLSTEISITIPETIAGKEALLSFQTPRIKMEWVQAINLIKKTPLKIKFNQPVDLSKISPQLKIEPAIEFNLEYGKSLIEKDGKSTEKKDETIIQLLPKENWTEDTKYQLTLNKDTPAKTGNITTENDIQKNFQTIRPFVVSEFNSPNNSMASFYLNLSHKIDSSNLATHLKITPKFSPEDWITLTEQWKNEPYKSSYFHIRPKQNWTPNQKYIINISPELSDKFGRKLGTEFKAEFTTKLPDRISPLYFPDHNTIFSSDTDTKFVFKYSGIAKTLKINLTKKLNKEKNEVFLINLPDASEKESTFEIDLKKDFPQIFSEESSNVGRYQIKIFEGDNKWPARSTVFYISDFAVSIKDFADNRFDISAQTFEGQKIEANTKKLEVWENQNLAKTRADFKIPGIIENTNHPEFLIELKDGRVGIGSTNFNRKMNTYDAQVDFSPWHYKNKITSTILTDRPLFRPGDTVYFKSIFRERENFGKSFPLKNIDTEKSHDYKINIQNPFWEEIFSTKETATGGELDGSWVIPTDAALGTYQLQLNFGKEQTSIPFHVQKFRKPKFLIEASFDQEQAIFKDKINAKIAAKYAFGGSLAHKKVNYTLSLFGHPKNCNWWCGSRDKLLTQGEGILDDNGEFNIPIDLDIEEDQENPAQWNLLTLNATVIASDDEISSIEKSVSFFDAERILDLDYGRYFYPPETMVTQTGKLTDLEKAPIKDQIIAELFLEKWVRNDRKNVDGDFYGEWKREDEKVWKEAIKSEKDGKFLIEFTTPKKSGNYFIRFTTEDDKERKISAENSFWISGQDFDSVRKNDQNRIQKIFADKDTYQIGEDVELFFPIADFEINPENSRATIERGAVLESLPIDTENRTIKFKTEAWMSPNIYVSVLLSGKDENNNQDVRWGSIKIPVSDPSRKLDISIEPIKKIYQPGDEIEVKIKTQINGAPTPASITLSVVDETLLALMSRPKLDLWKQFLAEVPLGVSTYHSLANFTSAKEMQEILDEVEKIKSRISLGHGGGGGGGQKGAEFKPRGDFKDTATFIAKIETDENGEAIAKFKAPDNLTTWNIWAVGHTNNNAFGESESSTQVTLPILVSEILPNGFQSGDEAQIGVLIRRNNTEQKSSKIKVTLNIPENISSKNKIKEVVVEEEARVFFPIKINESTDLTKDFEEVEIGFSIESDDGLKDAIVLKRKIFPPKVTLSVADFIRVEDTEKIRIFPDFVNAARSTLSLELSPSIVAKLETLIDVTKRMNYGCAEQRLSTSTAIMLQKELDKTLGKDSPEINLEALKANRDYIEKSFINNGFGYWSNAQKPNAWVTTNILENKWLWKEYGARFDTEKLEQSKQYLHHQIRIICKNNVWDCINDTTRNYAAAVLASNEILTIDDLDFLTQHTKTFESKVWWIRSARLLTTQGKKISPSSETFKESVWAEIQTNLKARDRYVFWEESERVFYSQNERLVAIIFEEVLLAEKWKELHHKVARYLIESKQKNLSGNTAMRMLRTLRFYAEKYEVKNFDAKFLAQTIGKNIKLVKGQFEQLDQNIKYEVTLNDDSNFEKFSGIELVTQNEKPFYADIKLTEILPADQMLPTSKGFFLERGIYELSDNELTTPITTLEKGKNYVVRLRIVTNAAHRQVALIDHAPAGAEFINLDFGNTDKTLRSYGTDGDCYGWCRPNFDHQEFHETSARFFTDYLSAGTHEVRYLIQARIAGSYEALPAQIEEMYFPEVFATTKGENIIIK